MDPPNGSGVNAAILSSQGSLYYVPLADYLCTAGECGIELYNYSN